VALNVNVNVHVNVNVNACGEGIDKQAVFVVAFI
jgi:hypothetical protein